MGVVVEGTRRGSVPEVLRLLGRILRVRTSVEPSVFVPSAAGCAASRLARLLGGGRGPMCITMGRSSIYVKCTFYRLRRRPFSGGVIRFGSLFVSSLYISRRTQNRRVNRDLFRCMGDRTGRLKYCRMALGM